ncbi:MAG: SGNH/GDSL hydrolase family protein [Microgenomates group bacterium]
MEKRYLFILLIVAQLIAILFLGKKIYIDKANTLGVSINVDGGVGEAVKKNPNSTLKYFYEPIANTTVSEVRPWDTSKVISTTINNDTLNNPTTVPGSAPATIMTIGDSFTYGQYVDGKNSWVRLLEKEVQRTHDVSVVNLGVPGYDIEYSVERFRIRGPKYNPKLVIWFLKDDDFVSIAERLTPIIEEEQKLFEMQEMREHKELFIPKQGHSDPIFIERALNRFLEASGGIKNIYEYQYKKLRLLREYYDGNIVIVYLPLKVKHLEMLQKWVKSDDKVILKQLPNLDKNTTFPDGHPNEAGHQSITQAIFQFLIEKNLLVP